MRRFSLRFILLRLVAACMILWILRFMWNYPSRHKSLEYADGKKDGRESHVDYKDADALKQDLPPATIRAKANMNPEPQIQHEPNHRIPQNENCDLDLSRGSMCRYFEFMRTGPCQRHRQQFQEWKSVITDCRLYELPLTCGQTVGVNIGQRGQITFHRAGRLGNNMYQYLAAYAMAKYHKMTLVISQHWDINSVFKLPSATLTNAKVPGHTFTKFIQDPDWNYDNKTLFLDPRKNIQLCGFFQTYQYIKDHDIEDEIIHKEFQIHDHILKQADYFLLENARKIESTELSVNDMVFVGIHVRRGDLTAYSYLQAADKDYFVRAMKHFTFKFPGRVVFVVCSHDIEWCKTNIETHRPIIFSENQTMAADFGILTRCNHTIATLGTFGEWAGYLAGGITIRYAEAVKAERLGNRPDGSVCTRRDKYESVFPRVIMM